MLIVTIANIEIIKQYTKFFLVDASSSDAAPHNENNANILNNIVKPI
jgi:hypothetical protein